MRPALLVFAVLSLCSCLEPLAAAPETPKAEWQCGPGTCSGCCKDNMCLGGNFETTCGVGGVRCAACADDHRCVTPGMCMPRPPTVTPDRNWVQPATNPQNDPPPQPAGRTCVYLPTGTVCS